MALVVYWYDFICFAIVAAAIVASLWVLWRKGVCVSIDGPVQERLLVRRSENVARSTDTRPLARVGSTQLWTSCWRGVHPSCLLLTRLVSFLVLAALLAWDVVEWGTSIFVYYTEWTFVLVIIYFAMGVIASTYGCYKYTQELSAGDSATAVAVKIQDANMEFHQRFCFLGYLMQTIYQTCAGAAMLTDVVFWLVIVPFLSNTHLKLNLLMGCMHTANAVLLLLDTTLNSLPFPWFGIAYFVQWSCLYIVFQWILHACGFTWWPYPFLELDRPWAPIWYLSMAIVHIPCYGAYAAITKAKNSILLKLFPNAFVTPY